METKPCNNVTKTETSDITRRNAWCLWRKIIHHTVVKIRLAAGSLPSSTHTHTHTHTCTIYYFVKTLWPEVIMHCMLSVGSHWTINQLCLSRSVIVFLHFSVQSSVYTDQKRERTRKSHRFWMEPRCTTHFWAKWFSCGSKVKHWNTTFIFAFGRCKHIVGPHVPTDTDTGQ